MKLGTCCALAITLCLAVTDAQANIACQANPAEFLGVDAGGAVLTSIVGSGRVKICNLNLELGGIPAGTCAGWYSALLSARMSRTQLTVYFDEASPQNAGITGCATLGEWTTRTPYFLEFRP